MKEKQQLYKEYLETDLTEHEFVFKMDLLKTKDVKKTGVVYTPNYIVDEMLNLSKVKYSDKIIEPSCGHGMFIFGLLNLMKPKLNNGKELLNWFHSHVAGIEIDNETVQELKESLSLYFKKYFSIQIESNYFTNIINADSLLYKADIEFDICIGNPPYVRTKNIDNDYLKNIRKEFSTCKKGNIDLYFAFIEKYISHSKKVCFITPNAFLRNESAVALRSFLSDKIQHLIDFKEAVIFDNARIYTCIFTASKYNKNTLLEYKNNLKEEFKNINLKDFFRIKENVQSDYIIYSSIATLADSYYMAYEKEGKFYAYYNDVEYEIEEQILIPYIKITKQQQEQLAYNYIIYPYDNNKKTIKEDIFKIKYPKTYRYLLAIKEDVLIKRDKGKIDKYEEWYSYGRKQGIYDFVNGDVVCAPLMIGGNCVPKKLDLSKLVSKYRRVLFTSGFLIPNTSENKNLYNFVLSKEFREHIKLHAKILPGKNEPYYNINVKLLRDLKFN